MAAYELMLTRSRLNSHPTPSSTLPCPLVVVDHYAYGQEN